MTSGFIYPRFVRRSEFFATSQENESRIQLFGVFLVQLPGEGKVSTGLRVGLSSDRYGKVFSF